MVYGLWFIVYGLWFIVYGLWFIVYGLWFIVYGLWFIVYGYGLLLKVVKSEVQYAGKQIGLLPLWAHSKIKEYYKYLVISYLYEQAF